MSYYTTYSLEARGINKEEMKMLENALDEKNILYYALDIDAYVASDGTIEYSAYDQAKWYTYEDDMVDISKQFPNATFKLHGEGESCYDMWDEYYHNGDSEYCEYVPEKPKRIIWEERKVWL